MHIRFEDWTEAMYFLERKKVPHGTKIIKIFASDEDPREKYGKATLKVVEVGDEPFREDEVFDAGNRGTFTGKDIEEAIAAKGTNELAVRTARALARFALQPELKFAQTGMEIKVDGQYLLNSPLEGIDGWKRTTGGQEGGEHLMHIDVISPKALRALGRIVDFEDSSTVRTYRDRRAYGMEMRSQRRSKEAWPN